MYSVHDYNSSFCHRIIIGKQRRKNGSILLIQFDFLTSGLKKLACETKTYRAGASDDFCSSNDLDPSPCFSLPPYYLFTLLL